VKCKDVKDSKSGPGDASAPIDACKTGCPCKPITSITIVSIEFVSDHALLKDYTTDWADGGARFPKPEWTAANQYPVSHTMDKNVEIKLTIEVAPPDACPETGTIHGEGPGSLIFEKKGYTFKPGKDTISLTSDSKLEKKIQELAFTINWTSPGTSVAISPSSTTNTMFVTMDTPTTVAAWPGITLKRMRHAVSAAGGANSLDPHKIVKHVISKWKRFNLSVQFDNAWELADDVMDSSGTQLVGADCQTIVRHTQNVILMVGCPGTAEAIVVWAKVPAPATGVENAFPRPNVSDPKQWYNDFNTRDPARATWRATLLDSHLGQNRFEACLKFTYGGITKYYAGGVTDFDTANQVIRVFRSLSWREDDTGVVRGDIFTY
jgi:hypothetical protein